MHLHPKDPYWSPSLASRRTTHPLKYSTEHYPDQDNAPCSTSVNFRPTIRSSLLSTRQKKTYATDFPLRYGLFRQLLVVVQYPDFPFALHVRVMQHRLELSPVQLLSACAGERCVPRTYPGIDSSPSTRGRHLGIPRDCRRHL